MARLRAWYAAHSREDVAGVPINVNRAIPSGVCGVGAHAVTTDGPNAGVTSWHVELVPGVNSKTSQCVLIFAVSRGCIEQFILVEFHLKTVAYTYGGADAALVLSRLEACDIPVFAHDFHTAITYSEIGGAMGGIRIDVPEGRIDEALAVLSETPLPTWSTPRLWPLIVMTLATVLFSAPFHARGTILATPNGRYSIPAKA